MTSPSSSTARTSAGRRRDQYSPPRSRLGPNASPVRRSRVSHLGTSIYLGWHRASFDSLQREFIPPSGWAAKGPSFLCRAATRSELFVPVSASRQWRCNHATSGAVSPIFRSLRRLLAGKHWTRPPTSSCSNSLRQSTKLSLRLRQRTVSPSGMTAFSSGSSTQGSSACAGLWR